jgi:hypothetical protein
MGNTESVERIPLEDRPALRELLARLWGEDKNGWCCMTDGSCDEMTDAEAAESIRNSLNYIESSYHLS